jgi:hypothetical protein
MDEWGDQLRAYEFCMGAMTGVAIIADQLCKEGLLDRQELMNLLDHAQNKVSNKRRVPLAMLLLFLELLADYPTFIV